MNWNEIKGVGFVADFSDLYLEAGLISRNSIFNKPHREVYGYLWDITTDQISGVGNIGQGVTGIMIQNDLDAKVVLGIFNRVFYTRNKDAMTNSVDQHMRYGIQEPGVSGHKHRWNAFREILGNSYSSDYIPVKKYLTDPAAPISTRTWIPLFHENSKMDKLSRKSYYEIIKWIMGNKTVILELPEKYEHYWMWEEAIKGEGPMGNPELPLIEKFAINNANSIKYIPENIVEKLDIGFLGEAADYGIF